MYYAYDASSNLISITLNGVEYFYVRNIQGDIIGLVDTNGTQVVSYSYDSWGKLISIDGSLKDSVGVKNPYRYRGYRYDTETGLYYLQSRYYNPEWGRFINADALVGQTGELLSHNVFAYCANDPVNREDPSGYFWEFIKEVISNIASAINAVKPVYAGAGGLAISDGPLPFGDAIGAAIAGVATLGAIGYGLTDTIISAKSKAIPHGNSKTSKKPQHCYEIYRISDGDVVKVGISGGLIRKTDGKSYRAEKQVRMFNSWDGPGTYASRIVAYLPDRQSALEFEWVNSQYRYSQGNSMKYHKLPTFDDWFLQGD